MTAKMHALVMALTTGIAATSLATPAHAYSVYTNRAAWEAALNSFTILTDSFSNTIPSAQSITLDSGIISTNSPPAVLPNSFNNNSVNVVDPGLYSNAVQAGAGTASNTINWVFPGPVVGFGADFIDAGSNRLSLGGNFDGTGFESLIVNSAIGGSDGFLGVIGLAPFTTITLGNASTTVDGFSVNNAYFAPVPGPLPVLGASAALGWSRRLRRRVMGKGRGGRATTLR